MWRGTRACDKSEDDERSPRRCARLVGWYLMVPPFQRGGVNLDAPLRSWRLFGSYDTANDCEDEHLEMVEKGKHAAPSGHLIMELAQCIASDDLRLKEK